MTELWKNGDIITAKKLNKIIFVNITKQVQIEEQSIIYQTDITPADVLDENNIPIGWIIFIESSYEESLAVTNYFIASDVLYQNGKYIVDANPIGASINMQFSAASKTDFFTASRDLK